MATERNRAKTKAIAEWLKESDHIAIITHIMPDGDALGSSLALMHALRDMGKSAFVCDRDAVPGYLHMLPGWETVVMPDAFPYPPKAVIAIDCADEGRMGTAGSLMNGDIRKAVIDHHETNKTAIVPALVDGEASASGVLVLDVIKELGAEITKEIALCLYTAISTDTGNFSFSNTTPEALQAVADCLKAGVDVSDMSYQLFRKKTQGRTKLLGRALNGIEYLADGQIALIRLRRADFAECGAADSDTEGIVNFGIDTAGAEVAILAVERVGSTKFSLRTRERVSASQVAATMGGGGHARAAGVTLQLPLNEAVDQVLAAFIQAVSE